MNDKELKTGIVKALKSENGYGFLTVEGEDEGVFFHARDIRGDIEIEGLKIGDVMSFEKLEHGDKGALVREVRLVANKNPQHVDKTNLRSV